MAEIQWEVTDQSVTQELVSKDHRWHISKSQKGHDEPRFFMSNYDLLLCPHGTGKDYLECFQTFLKSCDEFVALTQKIRTETEKHLQELIHNQETLEHENN